MAIYTVKYAACEDGLNWHVLDEDGDVCDSHVTNVAAKIDAAERNVEAEAEALRGNISDVLDDLDVHTLRKIASLIAAAENR